MKRDTKTSLQVLVIDKTLFNPMTIHEYKARFEETMPLAASLPYAAAEQTWNGFKSTIAEFLDEEYCDQIGFVAGIHKYYDGTKVHYDQSLFSVYFGRLIDNERRRSGSWNVAEIDCYFLYTMNPKLQQLNAHLQKNGFQIEDSYCKHDTDDVIQRKIDAIFKFVDQKTQLWDAIRELKPAKVDYHFWLY